MVRSIIRKLYPRDERAVSPVVGTILMVAVTVALAATVLTVVNGFGNKPAENAPSAVFKATAVDTNNDGGTDAILVTYVSGPVHPNADVLVNITNAATGVTMTTSSTATNWTAGNLRVYDAVPSIGTWFLTVSVLGQTTITNTISLDQ